MTNMVKFRLRKCLTAHGVHVSQIDNVNFIFGGQGQGIRLLGVPFDGMESIRADIAVVVNRGGRDTEQDLPTVG